MLGGALEQELAVPGIDADRVARGELAGEEPLRGGRASVAASVGSSESFGSARRAGNSLGLELRDLAQTAE